MRTNRTKYEWKVKFYNFNISIRLFESTVYFHFCYCCCCLSINWCNVVFCLLLFKLINIGSFSSDVLKFSFFLIILHQYLYFVKNIINFLTLFSFLKMNFFTFIRIMSRRLRTNATIFHIILLSVIHYGLCKYHF